jgi:hypothetical protein
VQEAAQNAKRIRPIKIRGERIINKGNKNIVGLRKFFLTCENPGIWGI